MKLSNMLLLVFILGMISLFVPKINNYLRLKVIWVVGIFILFFIVKFIEIHKRNKKNKELAQEIRAGYWG